MSRVIYEKKYPKEPLVDAATLPETAKPDSAGADEHLSYEAILKWLCEDSVSIPIPGRLRAAADFIRIAREVSELYHLDVKITEHSDRIAVDFAFNATAGLRELRKVVSYADDIAFFSNIMGYEIILCLDYYTHAVFRRGRLIHP